MDKKVIIITGAAMGIGYCAVEKFASNGWAVAAIDRSVDALETASEVFTARGFDFLAITADVQNYDECEAAVNAALAKYGRIDALYNNAGVLGSRDGMLDFDRDEIKDAFNVNVFGSLYMVQLVANAMVKLGTKGSIVNTSSINGKIATWDSVGYIGSKGAVEAMTRAEAFQLGEYDIRVNAVAPGFVNTPMSNAAWENKKARAAGAALHIRNRWIEPEQVADAAFFLCSDDAYAINGAVLPVDDGYVASKAAPLPQIFAEAAAEAAQEA